jgi:hypothetical protein
MFEEITEEFVSDFMDRYELIKEHIRRTNTRAYDRWKAGGFIVDHSVASYYPTLLQTVEDVGYEGEEEEEEDDDADEG